jgi:hypothetical protein
MSTTIHTPLPNPTADADPNWQAFSAYLRLQEIVEENSLAVRCYQGLDDGGRGYVKSSHLNHCLSLFHYGENSRYAEHAENLFGTRLDDYDYQKSLDELDNIFKLKAYKFTQSSLVFKGISCAPFYTFMNLQSCNAGEFVFFPGFLSTSVCRQSAESFCRGEEGILLEISGLDLVDSIVPENSTVKHSLTGDIPEQEILLCRNTHMRVDSVDREGSRNRVVSLRVTSGP